MRGASTSGAPPASAPVRRGPPRKYPMTELQDAYSATRRAKRLELGATPMMSLSPNSHAQTRRSSTEVFHKHRERSHNTLTFRPRKQTCPDEFLLCRDSSQIFGIHKLANDSVQTEHNSCVESVSSSSRWRDRHRALYTEAAASAPLLQRSCIWPGSQGIEAVATIYSAACV